MKLAASKKILDPSKHELFYFKNDEFVSYKARKFVLPMRRTLMRRQMRMKSPLASPTLLSLMRMMSMSGRRLDSCNQDQDQDNGRWLPTWIVN